MTVFIIISIFKILSTDHQDASIIGKDDVQLKNHFFLGGYAVIKLLLLLLLLLIGPNIVIIVRQHSHYYEFESLLK